MLEKLFKSFNGDKEDDKQKQELIKASNYGDGVVWHTDEDPEDEGKYLVFCNVGGIYTKAIAIAHFMWEEYDGRVVEWDIDRFLTQDPIKNDEDLKVLAWATLPSNSDSETDQVKIDQVKDAIDQIIKFGNIAYDSSTMLIWIGMLNDPVNGDHIPNIFMVASKLGIVEKLEKIVTTFEFCKSASNINSIDIKRLCNDFDDSMALMREVFMRLTEKTNPKTFDYAWEEAKNLHPGYSAYRDMINYIRRRNNDK